MRRNVLAAVGILVVALLVGTVVYLVERPSGTDHRAGPSVPVASPVASPSAPSVAPSAGLTYGTYSNPRFGFSVGVPSDVVAQPPPEDGDGLSWQSSDGQTTFTAYAADNVNDLSPKAFLRSVEAQAASAGTDVTYEAKPKGKDTVVALSGYTDEGRTVVYERHVVGPTTICSLRWSYPHAQQSTWQPQVDRTVATFTPGRP